MDTILHDPSSSSLFCELLKSQKIFLPELSLFLRIDLSIPLKLSEKSRFLRVDCVVVSCCSEDSMVKFQNLVFSLFREGFFVIKIRKENRFFKVEIKLIRIPPIRRRVDIVLNLFELVIS